MGPLLLPCPHLPLTPKRGGRTPTGQVSFPRPRTPAPPPSLHNSRKVMSEGSGELRACQDLAGLGKESSAKSPSQETGGGVFCPEECGSPSPVPWGAPKPAAREEQAGKGQGSLRVRQGAPMQDPPGPNASQSRDTRVGAGSKRSLGCPVRPLPCFPKTPINLAISCPMARPGPSKCRTQWPSGAGVEPWRLEPRPRGRARRGL